MGTQNCTEDMPGISFHERNAASWPPGYQSEADRGAKVIDLGLYETLFPKAVEIERLGCMGIRECDYFQTGELG